MVLDHVFQQGPVQQQLLVVGDQLGADLVYVDAVDRFLDKLAGVSDPEQKRKRMCMQKARQP